MADEESAVTPEIGSQPDETKQICGYKTPHISKIEFIVLSVENKYRGRKAQSDNQCRLLLRKRMLFRGAKGDDGANLLFSRSLRH